MSGFQLLLFLNVLSGLGVGALAFALMTARKHGKRHAAQIAQVSEANERLEDRLFALAESEERHRSLIEAQGDLIVRCKADGEILYANPAFVRLMDLVPEAAQGKGNGPPVLPAPIRASLVESRDDGTRLIDELIATRDGERWISWAETHLPLQNGAQQVQRVGRDVTARVASEQQLDEALAHARSANEAKSRFLATISHEFRTPLNGIIGMADLLSDTRLDAEQTTYVRALRTSGNGLLALIEEILDFAKVEAGRTILTEQPFDLVALTEGVIELLAPKAHDKRLSLAMLTDHAVPPLLMGDPDRVRQILINLVGNAVKFTETGGVGVKLGWDGDFITIRVEDTGPGIAEERLAAIFEEFEQAHESTARHYGGSGLGLAIVTRLLPLMGGSIEVDSRVGEGSRFMVKLALRSADAPEEALAPQAAGLTALLVSPAPFEAEYLAKTAELAGASVTLTADAADAQGLLMQRRYDVLMVDLAAGAERAQDLATLARAAGVRRSIIILSPFERRSFGAPAAAGFDAFLVKPVRGRSMLAQMTNRGGQAEAGHGLAVPEEAGPALIRPRVLLAEDNEINALLARRTLEKLGAEPVWAQNGREAADLMMAALSGTAAPFALCVFDVRMPVMDGLKAARLIRDEEAALGLLRRVPLIAVTANVSAEDRQAAMAAGFDDCLPKPLIREQLALWLKVAVDPSQLDAA